MNIYLYLVGKPLTLLRIVGFTKRWCLFRLTFFVSASFWDINKINRRNVHPVYIYIAIYLLHNSYLEDFLTQNNLQEYVPIFTTYYIQPSSCWTTCASIFNIVINLSKDTFWNKKTLWIAIILKSNTNKTTNTWVSSLYVST